METDMEKQGKFSQVYLNSEGGSSLKYAEECQWIDSNWFKGDQWKMEGVKLGVYWNTI